MFCPPFPMIHQQRMDLHSGFKFFSIYLTSTGKSLSYWFIQDPFTGVPFCSHQARRQHFLFHSEAHNSRYLFMYRNITETQLTQLKAIRRTKCWGVEGSLLREFWAYWGIASFGGGVLNTPRLLLRGIANYFLKKYIWRPCRWFCLTDDAATDQSRFREICKSPNGASHCVSHGAVFFNQAPEAWGCTKGHRGDMADQADRDQVRQKMGPISNI